MNIWKKLLTKNLIYMPSFLLGTDLILYRHS